MFFSDKVILIDSFQSTPVERIGEFEKKYGLVLPNSYIKFLQRTNGGKTNFDSVLSCPNKSIKEDLMYSVDLLFALDAGKEYGLDEMIDHWDLEENLRNSRELHDLRPDFLPVARDPGGNMYCIRVSSREVSEIAFWFHESGEFEKIVAPSWDAFLGNLYYSPDSWREASPMFHAIEQGRVDLVRKMLDSGKASLHDLSEYKWPPLHLAAWMCNPVMCRMLLEFGADANAIDIHGKTPLMFTNSVDVGKVLLDAGANIEAKSYTGMTPLLNALEHDEQRLAIVLIQRGADLSAISDDGKNVHSFCEQGNEYVLNFLMSW
jgi:FOG: Ankyrin repeat